MQGCRLCRVADAGSLCVCVLASPQATSLSTSHALSLHATASAIAEEALAAIATVKAFGAEEKEGQR